jgi:hypothetical protein
MFDLPSLYLKLGAAAVVAAFIAWHLWGDHRVKMQLAEAETALTQAQAQITSLEVEIKLQNAAVDRLKTDSDQREKLGAALVSSAASAAAPHLQAAKVIYLTQPSVPITDKSSDCTATLDLINGVHK